MADAPPPSPSSDTGTDAFDATDAADVTSDDTTALSELVGEWLTVPDLVEALGLSLRQVRRLIDDRDLVGVRIPRQGDEASGVTVFAVPAKFLQDGQVLPSLKGTMTVISDGGLTDEEAIRWLFTPDESLPIPGAPVDSLRGGRKTEVRRRAMLLAF